MFSSLARLLQMCRTRQAWSTALRGTLRMASPGVRGVNNSGRRMGRNQNSEGDEARRIPFALAPFPGWLHTVSAYSQAGRYFRGHGCPRSARADHGGSSTMNLALAGANPRERVPRAPAWPRDSVCHSVCNSLSQRLSQPHSVCCSSPGAGHDRRVSRPTVCRSHCRPPAAGKCRLNFLYSKEKVIYEKGILGNHTHCIFYWGLYNLRAWSSSSSSWRL